MNIPVLGKIPADSGAIGLKSSTDGIHRVGEDGVVSITGTGDQRVEFIAFEDNAMAFVNSALGHPAWYPIKPVKLELPVKAVLMDLDGTTVRSEDFWIWIIERSTATMLGDEDFALEDEDFPHVSGHSISEHLQYCVSKYCPERTVEEARAAYFKHTRREMQAILEGRGKPDAFKPAPGIKEFLLSLKEMGVKIGLATSGLYEKAWPEILSAFQQMDLGDPADFYDAIITAGSIPASGAPGTLGELALKPHPWLYAELARVALEMPETDRNHIVGIEDSGAGVCSIRLANFPVIGVGGGNLIESGTKFLCEDYCESFDEVLKILR